jgi:hypothetical protein
MPATPKGMPFAGLLESTKSLPALPHFLGDLVTGGRYGLSEKAPEFALEASGKYDELINKYLAEEGLSESARLPIAAKYGLAAGEMLGQLPVPGKMLERMTKKLPKAFKPAGWLAEYFGPTVDPKAVNYAVGTGLGRKPTVRRTEEGVTEVVPPKLEGTTIMKAPGGNWLPGSVEKFVDAVRREFVTANARPAERMRQLEDAMAKDPQNINLNVPGVAREKARLDAEIPVDQWLEKKLTNYVKNDMATARDPVRLGIEQRVAKVEADRAKAEQRIAKQQEKIAEAKAAGRDTTAIENRLALEIADLQQKYAIDSYAAGIPTLDRDMRNIAAQNRANAPLNRDPDANILASTPQSANWEDMTDYLVDAAKAGDILGGRFPRLASAVDEAPWLAKVPPETPVYSVYRGNPEYFNHVRDELYNSVREGSDLPPELKLDPEDLDKMNMDAAVAHVSKVDAWRERNRISANLAKSNNPAVFTVKQYPGTGLEWKQLKMPEKALSDESKMLLEYNRSQGVEDSPETLEAAYDEGANRALQEALEYEGSVMGHCVGDRYCEPVKSGKTQIFSLRDAKGEPHVTIEVRPKDVARSIGALPAEERGILAQEIKDKYFGGVMPGRSDEDKFFQLLDQAYVEKYGQPPPDIVQIKGKGNKKPADKYIPFVQDFVRSGNFGQIGDFYNTNLVKVTPGQRLPGLTKEIPPGLYTNAELKQMAIDSGMPKEILDNWMQKLDEESIFKYADGGRVEEEEYDEAEIERIVAPLRAKLEGYLGEAKKLPRKAKQAVADVTEIGDIIKRSKEIPLTYYDPKGEVAGEADAMRHLLFQAQLQQKYGELPAKAISYLHEYSSFGQPSAEREMDFLNDELGREIGRSAKSDRELVEMARRYIESGRAKTLPKEQRGGY